MDSYNCSDNPGMGLAPQLRSRCYRGRLATGPGYARQFQPFTVGITADIEWPRRLDKVVEADPEPT
jgi:hypothetical protein